MNIVKPLSREQLEQLSAKEEEVYDAKDAKPRSIMVRCTYIR